MADGLRGVFVDRPDGTPYFVMGNELRGPFVDAPEGLHAVSCRSPCRDGGAADNVRDFVITQPDDVVVGDAVPLLLRQSGNGSEKSSHHS